MSEQKHTPGPWRVEKIDQHHGDYGIQVVGSNDEVICDNEAYYPHALDEKNAHLIAAAPEMLKALCDLVEAVEDNDRDSLRELLAAHSAIAKAKGSPA